MTVSNTLGVSFAYGDGASPEVFTNVAQLQSVNGFGISRSRLDQSLLVDNVTKTKPGRITVKPVTLGVLYDPDDTTHNKFWTDVTTEDLADGNFRLNLDEAGSPATTFTMAGYIGDFDIDAITPDGLLLASFVLEFNSIPTKA